MRLFTLGLDAHLGVNLTSALTADGKPGIQPTIVGLDAKNITIRVSNTDLLQEPPTTVAAVFPALLGLAGSALGGALGTFALPSLAGFSFDGLSIQKVTTSQDDFVGILGVLHDGLPMPMPVQPHPSMDGMNIPGPNELAALFNQGTIPQPNVPSSWSGARPSIRMNMAADAAGPVEYSWRIDNGMWSGWTSDTHPTIDDTALLFQGHHVIYTRARLVGNFLTESAAVPMDVLIDSVPPELHPVKDGERVAFGGFDYVTDALSYQWNGKSWSTVDGISYADADAATAGFTKLLNLSVRDEAGNVTTQAVDVGALFGFHGRIVNSTGGCSFSGGSDENRGVLVVFAALLALLAFRRRSMPLLGLLAAFGFFATSCAHSTSGCQFDDDCKNSCPSGQLTQCQEGACGCTPDLALGETGRFSSLTVIGGNAYVSAYNNDYGDLMIGHVTPPGVVASWDFVDGVPDSAPDEPSSQVRGGVSDKGDDDGRYSSIAATPNGDPVIAYYDATHGALKYASFGVIRWHAQTIDAGLGTGAPDPTQNDVGRWASLTLAADGTPGIAYTAIINTGTTSGKPEGQLRWAQATVVNPQTGSDWKVTILDARPLPAAVSDPAPLLPDGIGLMPSAARKADGSPAVCYYDSTLGNLRYVEFDPGSSLWGTPIILDGQSADGKDTGDVGRYSSLTFDENNVGHIAYVDATHGDLLYLDTQTKTPEVVDDGQRPMDEQTMDNLSEPVRHLVGDSSSIAVVQGKVFVAYQDSTALELQLAERGTSGGWALKTIAGHANPFAGSYGFYADLKVSGSNAIISSYGINQQQTDTTKDSFYVEVFDVPLDVIQ